MKNKALDPRQMLAKKVGEIMRNARIKKGLSADKLIQMSGDRTLSKPLICQYEKGNVLIGYDRLQKLMDVCGTKIDDELQTQYLQLANDYPELGQIRPSKFWEEFVRTWQTSKSVKEVADKLGISRLQASMKANVLRSKGAKLRRMLPMPRIDWNSLIALASENLSKEDAEILERMSRDPDEVEPAITG